MYNFHLLSAISEVPAAKWDALHHSQAPLQHAFLQAFESSHSVGRGTGWHPCHATLWQGDALIAALPLYQKHHSFGEYVFDWRWAEAYAQHGLPYYPKYLAAIPFSPLPGPRLLATQPEHAEQLLHHLIAHLQQIGAPSLHLLFVDDTTQRLGLAQGLLQRRTVQFHWHNQNWQTFDDFLAQLSHDKRKKIRQERRKVSAAGVTVRTAHGNAITPADWDYFYHCYTRTYLEHGGQPYLTRQFFRELAQHCPELCVLCIAERDNTPVASSFLLRDQHVLYGRYWGCTERIPNLHFELCYYQAIEYAITHQLQRFEGGAQGEHKLARGLAPVDTHSLHWIADPDFRAAIARFVQREGAATGDYLEDLQAHSAYKATD